MRLIIEILIFLTCFINYKIWLLSIADWALLALNAIALAAGARFWSSPVKKAAGMLMAAGLFLSLAANFWKPYFSMGQFFQSSVKLLIYIFSIGILPGFLKEKRIGLAGVLKHYIYLTCFSALFQHAAVRLFGRESWPLYSMGSIFFGYMTDTSMFASGGIMRARTFYMEPGPMAVHISMLFALLLFTEKKIPVRLHIAYLFCAVSTLSFSAIATVCCVYAAYFVELKYRKHVLRLAAGSMALLVFLAVLYCSSDYIQNRVMRMVRMEDYSAVLRTFGTFHALLDAPWYGVGAGNHAAYFMRFGKTEWYNGTGEFYNVIILSALTMGYLGMAGLLLYQYYFLKQRPKLLFVFLVTQGGWGYLFSTPVWVFLILGSVLISYADSGIKPLCWKKIRGTGFSGKVIRIR